MGRLTGLLTSLSSGYRSPKQRRVKYWENAWTERSMCFCRGLSQVCNLCTADWWLPRDSQWNTRPGLFVNFGVAGSPGPQFAGGAVPGGRSTELFISANCRGLQPCEAVPALSSFHIRRALCNLPACYEHEVNKTLGHHKSPANDMSGAEIRRPAQHSGAHRGRAGKARLPLRCPAACSSFSPPRSQCVRSLLKLQLN